MPRTVYNRRRRFTDDRASAAPAYRAWVTNCLDGAFCLVRLDYKRWGVSRVRETRITAGIPWRDSREVYPAKRAESNTRGFLSLAASA